MIRSATATAIRRRAAPDSYLNVDAFSRPAGRGDYGDAARTFFRLPKIVLSNMSVFKNFNIGGSRRLQVRWEAYNVFNQVNWSAINTTATFNPQGQQTNANFGQATASRAPRIMQGAFGLRSEAGAGRPGLRDPAERRSPPPDLPRPPDFVTRFT